MLDVKSTEARDSHSGVTFQKSLNNNKNIIKKLREEQSLKRASKATLKLYGEERLSQIHYCYYSATTKNTEALVERLGGVGVEINSKNCRDIIIDKPAILIFPTYAIKGKILPPPVGYFLSNPMNRKLIRGVIGTGDTLFNEHFCFGAVKASEKLGVPLIHKVELKGTETDVKIIQKFILENNLL